MSILFTCEQGWIISHLEYINNIYNSVEDHHEKKIFKFHKSFFNVNSQYLRQNQLKVSNNKEEKKDIIKKRKRKTLQTLSEDVLKNNNFVGRTSIKILNNAKHLKLFTNNIFDNNEESRLESKKFYLNSLQLNCNYHGFNNKECSIIVELQNEKYIFPKNSTFYCYDIREISDRLKMLNNYNLIVLDPPWWNKSIRRKKIKLEESSYKMMYNEELSKIPIGSLLHSNGIVAVWCTNCSNHLTSILKEIFPAWGIVFKARWYWLKVTVTGEPICDFNEIHGKQPYEQIIIGTVSSNIKFNIPMDKIIISVPSAVHSHKPPLADILKTYLPENPQCLEIFARYLLPEWTSWGLEVLKFQHLSLYSEVK